MGQEVSMCLSIAFNDLVKEKNLAEDSDSPTRYFLSSYYVLSDLWSTKDVAISGGGNSCLK